MRLLLLACLAALAAGQVTATPNGGNCTVKACRQQARKGCNEIGAFELACRLQRTMECFAKCGLQKDGTPIVGAPQLSRAERALAAANANLRLALRLFALRDEAALGALQEAGDATTTASTTAGPTPAPFNPFTDGGPTRRTRRTRTTSRTAAPTTTTTTTTTTTSTATPPANTPAPTPAMSTAQRDALHAELAAVQGQIPDCKGEATCLADLNEVIKTIRAQLQ